jgi:hypothetical protein
MHFRTLLFLTLVALSSTVARAADDAAPATAPSAAPSPAGARFQELMAPLVGGEWRIEATWSNGDKLKARATYAWNLGKNFVTAKTYPMTPDGKEYQRYETIFGMKDGKLWGWSFVYDGTSDEGEWTVEGKKISNVKPMKNPSGEVTSKLHQSVEVVEPNKMQWKVAFERGGEMHPIMDGYWVRDPATLASDAGGR